MIFFIVDGMNTQHKLVQHLYLYFIHAPSREGFFIKSKITKGTYNFLLRKCPFKMQQIAIHTG